MLLRRFVFGLVVTFLLSAPVSAGGISPEECRAMHATKRKTALERWRGPRSNANKYPLHCEHEWMLAAVPSLSNLQLGNLGGGGLGNASMPSTGASAGGR